MIKVQDYREIQAEPAADGVTMRVPIGPDDGAPIFNMRVFEVEPGHATPHHSHWWEHEVFVLSGQGLVLTDEGEKPVSHGTTVFVPGGEMHRFRNTGDEVLRFICLVPQEWLHGVERPQA